MFLQQLFLFFCILCISSGQELSQNDVKLPEEFDDVSDMLMFWGNYQYEHLKGHEEFEQDSPQKQYLQKIENILQQIFQNDYYYKVDDFFSYDYNDALVSSKVLDQKQYYNEFDNDYFTEKMDHSQKFYQNQNEENSGNFFQQTSQNLDYLENLYQKQNDKNSGEFLDENSNNLDYQYNVYQKENREGLEEFFGEISDDLYRQVFSDYDAYYYDYNDNYFTRDSVDSSKNLDQKYESQTESQDWEKLQEILAKNQMNFEKFDKDYKNYDSIYGDIQNFFYVEQNNSDKNNNNIELFVEEFQPEKIREQQNFQTNHEIIDEKQLIQTVNNIVQDAVKQMQEEIKYEEENLVKYTVINIHICKEFIYFIIFLITIFCLLVIYKYSINIINNLRKYYVKKDFNKQEFQSPLQKFLLQESDAEDFNKYYSKLTA